MRGNSAVRVNPVAERARDRCYMRVGVSQAMVSSGRRIIVRTDSAFLFIVYCAKYSKYTTDEMI